jgi:hypothetical protein
MKVTDERRTIFVSHATPADNEFAIWLSARLSAVGYEVWCDQERLLGGEDFWRDIEDTLRTRAVKFVLVISGRIRSESGAIRDGIAKEIAVADALKKKLGDPYFVIPALIDDTPYDEFGIEFIRLNGINFRENWASGLAKLLEVLERDSVAHDATLATPSMTAWREVHQNLSRSISNTPETLHSNWLEISKFPDHLHFYEIQQPLSFSEIRSIASECSLPCVDHGRLLGSFAGLDELQASLGESVTISARGTLLLSDFLEGRTDTILGISPGDARNKVSSLARQAWDRTVKARGLTPYIMANGQIAWWFPDEVPADGQLRYLDANGKMRRRAVKGIRGKKEGDGGVEVPRYYWHLGFTAAPFISDASHIVLKPRLIISEDGKTPLENKTKLNAVRRAVTKMWFNDKWRGLVLGFSAWMAEGGGTIMLDVGGGGGIALVGHPIEFSIPFGISSDPISIEEEDEERFEQEEVSMRLDDPAFDMRDDEEEGA